VAFRWGPNQRVRIHASRLADPREFSAEPALQCAGDPTLTARFDNWNARTLDLPGAYFLQTAEWHFRENRLARAVVFRRLAASPDCRTSTRRSSSSPTTRSSPCRRRRRSRLCVAQPTSPVRIEPGRRLSLFMGQRTLGGAWRRLARHRRLAQAKGQRRRVTIRRWPCRGSAGGRVEFADQVQLLSRDAAACETHATGLAMRLTYIPMSASLARAFSSSGTSVIVASVSSRSLRPIPRSRARRGPPLSDR
jgi:hypothetical protein